MEVDQIIEARWIIPVIPEQLILHHHALIIKDSKIFDLLPILESRKKYFTKEIINYYKLSEDHVLIPGI